MKTNIVVTGGTGLVGKSLQRIMPNATYLGSKDYDLTDNEQVKLMYNRYKPTTVIHLAAEVSGITDNIARPAELFDKNVLMNTLVLKGAKESGAKNFIGMLSTCVYPDVASTYPLTESMIHDGAPTPTNFSYAIAKRALAAQIDAYRQQYDLQNYCYFIPCNLYGLDDKFDETRAHFVGALIKKIHDAKISGADFITLYGTGKPLRQFMFADDVAEIIKYCVNNKVYRNMNIAPDVNFSIREIVMFAQHACDAIHLEVIYDATKPDGQYRKDCDNRVLYSVIPNMKLTSLYDGLEKTYNHYVENQRLSY